MKYKILTAHGDEELETKMNKMANEGWVLFEIFLQGGTWKAVMFWEELDEF